MNILDYVPKTNLHNPLYSAGDDQAGLGLAGEIFTTLIKMIRIIFDIWCVS